MVMIVTLLVPVGSLCSNAYTVSWTTMVTTVCCSATAQMMKLLVLTVTVTPTHQYISGAESTATQLH